MQRKLIVIGFVLSVSIWSGDSMAQSVSLPWYQQDTPPETLIEALERSRAFLGRNNPGSFMRGSTTTCETLGSVGIDCDYNTRSTLSMFLTLHGKGLFPAEGGTNPYFSTHDENDRLGRDPNDYYIGTAEQNSMLLSAVRRNSHLFRDGDLSGEDVVNHWR